MEAVWKWRRSVMFGETFMLILLLKPNSRWHVDAALLNIGTFLRHVDEIAFLDYTHGQILEAHYS